MIVYTIHAHSGSSSTSTIVWEGVRVSAIMLSIDQHMVKLLQTAYLYCDWYNEQVNSRTLGFPSNHTFSCLTFCMEVYLVYTIEHYELVNFTNAMILFSFSWKLRRFIFRYLVSLTCRLWLLQLSAVHLALMEVPVFAPIHVRVELDGMVTLVKMVRNFSISCTIYSQKENASSHIAMCKQGRLSILWPCIKRCAEQLRWLVLKICK